LTTSTGPPQEPEPPAIPLIPPDEFVARFNAGNPGRYRTALDPLVMAAWHATSRPPPLSMLLVTGL
jgi:hypothetical protein